MPRFPSPLCALTIIGAVLTAFPSPSLADSLVETINGQKSVMRDNIIYVRTHTNAGTDYFYYYYLHGGKFIEESNNSSKNNLVLVSSSGPERLALLKLWKDAGWQVEVKDQQLKKTIIYNFCVHPVAPNGNPFLTLAEPFEQIVLATNPAPTTIRFEKIDEIDVKGENLTVKLTDGTKVTGPLAPIDHLRRQSSQRFDGWESYGPATPKRQYVFLDKIREIRFIRKKDETGRLGK